MISLILIIFHKYLLTLKRINFKLLNKQIIIKNMNLNIIKISKYDKRFNLIIFK